MKKFFAVLVVFLSFITIFSVASDRADAASKYSFGDYDTEISYGEPDPKPDVYYEGELVDPSKYDLYYEWDGDEYNSGSHNGIKASYTVFNATGKFYITISMKDNSLHPIRRLASFNVVKGDFSVVKISIPDQMYETTFYSKPIVRSYLVGKFTCYITDDFDVTYGNEQNPNNLNAGTGSVTITPKGKMLDLYSGSKVVDYNILPFDLTNSEITYGADDVVYNGKAQKTGIRITALLDGKKYYFDERDADAITFKNNTNAGLASFVFKGSNFSGKVNGNFTILPYDISKARNLCNNVKTTYTGSALKPEPTLTLFSKTLVKGTDYTLGSYKNNVNAAYDSNSNAPQFTITGKGNFTGNYIAKFSIYPASLSNATIEIGEYTRLDSISDVMPTKVMYNGMELQYDKDYRINNSKSTDSSYNIRLTGIGNYSDEVWVSAKVNQIDLSNVEVEFDQTDLVYDGHEKKPDFTVYGINHKGERTEVFYSYYSYEFSKNTNAGKATLKLSPGAYNNYTVNSKTVQFTIARCPASNVTIKKIDDVLYTGNPIEPEYKIYDNRIYKDLVLGKDYDVVIENNVNPGTAQLTFTLKGNYKGTKKATFAIKENPDIPTPTPQPTAVPTAVATVSPTAVPSAVPTAIATVSPTAVPTDISMPTATPTQVAQPTLVPSPLPTALVTPEVIATITAKPTVTSAATVSPTSAAGATPSVTAQPDITDMPDDPQTKILAFVERIYIYVLDREPEKEGAAFWSDELYAFRRTGAEVAQGFIFSPEFENRKTSDEQFVTILYKTFFGRDPEEDGMKFWLSQLATGTMDRVTVANGFIYSQEWADTCASYGIRSGGDLKPTGKIAPTELTYAFVERMYTTAMGRGYDEEGRQYWASELANFNITGENVGASFFLSDEMNGYNLSDKEFLGRLYATFMNREPDADGEAYWLSQMSAGVSRADIVFGFTRSPEFTDKCIEARILPF